MMQTCLPIVIALLLLFVVFQIALRIVRRVYKFPMPEFMAPIIDNPLRRRAQPPDEMARRHGLEPGMRVLEIGPGSGRYTVAAARRVGPTGKVIAVDIEPKMIERLNRRVEAEGVANVEGRVANVYALPFDDASFDAAYLITVIGEIPEPVRAMREFHRVLKPGGALAFSEALMDPDYPLARTLMRMAESAGFRLRNRIGGWFAYTLVFEKAA